MTTIGIMQGRLSPPHRARLQAFPWDTWAGEFERARQLGFGALEWVFESEREAENPIRQPQGRARIRQRIADTGIAVPSVCADYFMAHPFVRVGTEQRDRSVSVLIELLGQARAIGASVVLVPVLEQAELRTEAERLELAACLREPLALARSMEMRIGLEAEVPAAEYLALLEAVNHESAGAYYDLGNAAAKGLDAALDLRALAKQLCGIHVKDRPRHGASTMLGGGAVDFPAVFDALTQAGYAGPLILQTAFGADFASDAAANLAFVRRHLVRSGEPEQAAVSS